MVKKILALWQLKRVVKYLDGRDSSALAEVEALHQQLHKEVYE